MKTSAAPTSRTVTVRLPRDVYDWLVGEQERLYTERGLRLSLSSVVRSVLEQTKVSGNGRPKR